MVMLCFTVTLHVSTLTSVMDSEQIYLEFDVRRINKLLYPVVFVITLNKPCYQFVNQTRSEKSVKICSDASILTYRR